jgi:hypothetical protein
MKNLKRLGLAVALTLVLGLSAFADNPCVPGQLETMPCTVAQPAPADPIAPGETSAPPASNAGSGYSVTGAVVNFLESMLSIL